MKLTVAEQRVCDVNAVSSGFIRSCALCKSKYLSIARTLSAPQMQFSFCIKKRYTGRGPGARTPSVWDIEVSHPLICVLSVFNLWLKNIAPVCPGPFFAVFATLRESSFFLGLNTSAGGSQDWNVSRLISRCNLIRFDR